MKYTIELSKVANGQPLPPPYRMNYDSCCKWIESKGQGNSIFYTIKPVYKDK